VSKSFGGRICVDRLSFAIAPGEVFALLGPNGAGKTTAVRMLVGILRPDEGRIETRFEGRAGSVPPPGLTGYLPEDRGLYRELPVHRSLVYFGRLRGLERAAAERAATAWLERVGLRDRAGERLDALSKGNQQRVQLGAALLHRPALAVLDEPFSGLDPISQEFFLDLLRDLRAAGTAVLLSAHQMDLVERAADRVLLVNHGREILCGSLEELRGRIDRRQRLRLTVEPGADPAALSRDPDVEASSRDGDEILVTLRAGASLPPFLARCAALAPLRAIVTERPRLHDVFVRAVREDDAASEGAP
jgi:ABC-2 type transport system ATP-binding protein